MYHQLEVQPWCLGYRQLQHLQECDGIGKSEHCLQGWELQGNSIALPVLPQRRTMQYTQPPCLLGSWPCPPRWKGHSLPELAKIKKEKTRGEKHHYLGEHFRQSAVFIRAPNKHSTGLCFLWKIIPIIFKEIKHNFRKAVYHIAKDGVGLCQFHISVNKERELVWKSKVSGKHIEPQK